MYKVSTINAQLTHDADLLVVIKDGQAIDQVAGNNHSDLMARPELKNESLQNNKLTKPCTCTDTV